MHNTHRKLWILSGLLTLSGGLTYAASTLIKPDLNNAVQSIEQIFFSSTGNPDAKEILMHNQDGMLMISGSFYTTSDQGSSFQPSDHASVQIWGLQNASQGSNTAAIVGAENKIHGGENNTFFAWDHNEIWIKSTIKSQNKENILFGGRINKIPQGNDNLIIGGAQTTLATENNRAISTYNSTLTSPGSTNNTLLGKNIKIEDNTLKNTLIWTDNKTRNWENDFKEIRPQTSDTLYLRTAGGLAVNHSAPSAGVDVAGLTQIGDEAGACTSALEGTIIYRDGCFYACSDASKWRDNLSDSHSCASKQNMMINSKKFSREATGNKITATTSSSCQVTPPQTLPERCQKLP